MYEPFKGTFIINDYVKNHSCKIASFDLDNTLIRHKNDARLTNSNTGWSLVYGVKNKLKELVENDYKIVIITNQCGSKFDHNEFHKKISNVVKELDVPLQVIVCTESGYCKKPSVGMWRLLELNNGSIKIDTTKSFYVGDAAGRSSDVSDMDYKFAINNKIKFYIPDEYFDDCKIKIPLPIHPVALMNSKNEIMDESSLCTGEKEIIILVGPPACGKTIWCGQSKFKNYTIINQENHKIKTKIMLSIKHYLLKGQNVIVDKRNEYAKDREEIITIAKNCGASVKIVWFDFPKSICEHICTYREIMYGKEVPHIIISKYYSKIKGFDPPTEEECKVLIKHFNINRVGIDIKITDMNLFMQFLV